MEAFTEISKAGLGGQTVCSRGRIPVDTLREGNV